MANNDPLELTPIEVARIEAFIDRLGMVASDMLIKVGELNGLFQVIKQGGPDNPKQERLFNVDLRYDVELGTD